MIKLESYKISIDIAKDIRNEKVWHKMIKSMSGKSILRPCTINTRAMYIQ